MAYADSENSAYAGQPRELYKFIGTYGNYLYCSGQQEVQYNGDTYMPVVMKRDNVVSGTQADDANNLSVYLPVSAQLVQDYAFGISPPDLDLLIYRYHDLSDVQVYWSGTITNVSIQVNIATLTSPSILSWILTGSIPSRYYQTPCNNVLFDSFCKASRAAFEITTTITSIDDLDVVIASNGGHPDGFFVGGEVVLPSQERRMIISHSGLNLVLSYPFSQAQNGESIQVAAGCDHAYTGDCLGKFNNQPNFGGFPFIPNVNPFTSGIDS